jgi:hypothetical protein
MDEIDCNPVLVLPLGKGLKVLDALMIPRKSSQGNTP